EVQALRNENDRLNGVVKKSDNLQALNQPTAHDDVIKSELASAADRLEGENEVLRAQAQRPSGVSTGDASSGLGALGSLQRQNSRLQNALFSMKLDKADVDDKNAKITDAVKMNAAIRTQVAAAQKPAGWDETQGEAFALKQENDRLQKQLDSQGDAIQL